MYVCDKCAIYCFVWSVVFSVIATSDLPFLCFSLARMHIAEDVVCKFMYLFILFDILILLKLSSFEIVLIFYTAKITINNAPR